MAAKTKGGLGRGLDSIFYENTETASGSDGRTYLKISDVEPRKDQPRKSFDSESLAGLADSISEHGIIQPLIVRRGMAGFYEIIAGERRWRAAKMAGLTEIPVVILDSDDKKTAEISLIENIQREDLNPVEEAEALELLMNEYGMTQEALSKRIGKSRSAIANAVRLLDLTDGALALLKSGALSAGHARALLGLKDEERIDEIAEIVVEKELSVRATEALVKNINTAPQTSEETAEKKVKDDAQMYIEALEKEVRKRIGRKIKISSKGKTHKVEIEYTDDRDLETLLKLIAGDDIFD